MGDGVRGGAVGVSVGAASPVSLVAVVLSVGGGVLVVVGVLWQGRGGQVQTPVAIVVVVVVAAVVVLLLHVRGRHLLPQLLQIGRNHACHKQIG